GEDDDGQLALGFHRQGRWNEIDDIEHDVLASPDVDALRLEARDWARAEGLSAWDRREGGGFLRNLVVREGMRCGQLQARREGRPSGQIQARVVTSAGHFRADALAAAVSADSVLWTRTGGVAETTREGETILLRGEDWIEETVGGLRFRVSHEAFFQTNTDM